MSHHNLAELAASISTEEELAAWLTERGDVPWHYESRPGVPALEGSVRVLDLSRLPSVLRRLLDSDGRFVGAPRS